MYSGEDKSSKTAETVDFPKEAKALLEPFGIQYVNGKVGIGFRKCKLRILYLLYEWATNLIPKNIYLYR